MQKEYHIQSFQEAYDLSVQLAAHSSSPTLVGMGLAELLLNAIEHGNLEIDYALKTELKAKNSWMEEIQNRLLDPRYRERRVHVQCLISEPNGMQVIIRDQGRGFDWVSVIEKIHQPVVANAHQSHGRGILLAHSGCFSRLEYRGAGNEVWCFFPITSPDIIATTQ